ncbi:hypothetical protein [Aggregatilinea lenta]|uniref:hypothetical protein n=1 Tax=Aggregatilinea lenta TaxID=913108 RepID=UPI000E5B9D63|nr:hypothetical protein [Aggregatilinea lenta]
MTALFPIIILNGRPAAGKSELLAYLRSLPADQRRERHHIGELHEIDDFPMLWTWFEEDALLEDKFGRARLHTTPDGDFLYEDLWHLLVERMNLDYTKLVRDDPGAANDTTLIEFSRGSEHGGYRKAYAHLSETILRQAAIFYIDVPYEESLRKNRRRFNPDKPDSILEHGLTDAKLERLYHEVDWEHVSAGDPEVITINGIDVPYAVFPNSDDVTTTLGEVFEQRLENTLGTLWARYTRLHAG